MYKLTEEQLNIIDVVRSNKNKITTVSAVAGSGKSSTSREIVKAIQPRTGMYTAFNRAIVKDNENKFEQGVQAKTLHSLAHYFVRPKNIEEFSYLSIKEQILYEEKKKIINVINLYFQSKYISFDDFISNNDKEFEKIAPICFKYIKKMYKREIPISFGFLLKYFHILLAEKKIKLDLDIFILDEAQDISAVSLEILKLINAPYKVVLGDEYQNIYSSFLNTVNAFVELDDTIPMKLTKSFRCNSLVAKQIDVYGKKYLNEDFCFTGVDNEWSYNAQDSVYLSFYNLSLISIMEDFISRNIKFNYLKKIDDVFALPISIINIASGNKATDVQYKFLENEYDKFINQSYHTNFFSYLSSLYIEEVSIGINAIKYLNNKKINIFNLKNKVKGMKRSNDIILSTTHSFKGLEKNTSFITKCLTDKFDKDEECKRLLYVAMSRSKHNNVFEDVNFCNKIEIPQTIHNDLKDYIW